MEFEEQKFNNQSQKLEKESLDPFFLQKQIHLPKEKWSEEFKKLIENKTIKNRQEIYNSYLHDLDLNEDDLKNRKVFDLGCGGGEFIESLIENKITSEAYGIDINLSESMVEKYHGHFIRGNYQEKFSLTDVDFVVAIGSIPTGNLNEEDIQNIKIIIKNSLESLKENGEIRISSIRETANTTPMNKIEDSRQKWEEIIKDISKTQKVECEIIPRDVSIIGYDNEIILNSVLIIRKK